jgi:fimbrial chaperone protein
MKHFIFLGVLILTSAAWAFRVNPMEAQIKTTGPARVQIYRLDNNGPEKIAVEISLKKRSNDRDGKETLTDTDELNLYPEQLTLNPGETRNVQVSWIGEPEVKTEKAYRLIAEQLPVELKPDSKAKEKKKQVQLKFMVRYVASLYVASGTVTPRVKILSQQVLSTDREAGQLELVLKNEGTAHQVLTGTKVFFKIEGKKKIPAGAEVEQKLQAENILAGEERRFVLPLPSELTKKKVTVELEFPKP